MTKPSWSSTSGGVKGDGTLPYKAPELESLDSTKAKSSDMYAFGITIASVSRLVRRSISRIDRRVLGADARGESVPKRFLRMGNRGHDS